jgi:hypothetical protein
MEMVTQVLEITFEVQKKMNGEKITRREINVQLIKHNFFSLDPSYFQTS